MKHRSLPSNMLSFLKKTHEARGSDPNSETVVFYTDFFKTFDRVPHYEIIQNVTKIGVGGCVLETLINYLGN